MAMLYLLKKTVCETLQDPIATVVAFSLASTAAGREKRSGT